MFVNCPWFCCWLLAVAMFNSVGRDNDLLPLLWVFTCFVMLLVYDFCCVARGCSVLLGCLLR